MREYELMFVVDPRLSDEEVVELSDQYKSMIESAGGEIFKAESWGKRKLAYEIQKLSEGNYTLFHIRSENGSSFIEAEQRMRQNDKVLRYLTVRTDSGRLRKRGTADQETATSDSSEGSDESEGKS